ncbi:MAG: RluA family pseudouridine synthase [Anaerolineales bacterium]|jgi:RluA family pseudouridine synthase
MDILYNDSSILVVNKPPGLATLPGSWDKDSASLFKILEADYLHIWVVHRLDKVTSGLVVFARTAQAHRNLNMQFEQHKVHKVYHAIIVGTPVWDEHIAHHPLRINVGHSHRTIVDHSQGRPSETTFHILERFNGYAFLEAIPATGRTHQVRVHAYALGFPLLNDTLYSAPATDLISRPALHARILSFTHPVTGEGLTFSATYPPDFEKALLWLRSHK